MTGKAFEEILTLRIAKIRAVLSAKAREYATSEDRLHSFKEAALLGADSPGEALLGMLRKHWVSIMDLVRDPAAGLEPRQDQVDEKIGDAMNYLILLEAILLEGKVPRG